MADAVGANPNWKLPTNLIALSEAQVWEEALGEWKTDYVDPLDSDEEMETCLCTHNPIREVWHILNTQNFNTAIVGNCCIKKFTINPKFKNKHKIFDCFKRLKTGRSTSANKELIKYAFRMGIFTLDEREFYIDIWRKRKLSHEDAQTKQALNQRLIEQIKIKRTSEISESEESSDEESSQSSAEESDHSSQAAASPIHVSDSEAEESSDEELSQTNTAQPSHASQRATSPMHFSDSELEEPSDVEMVPRSSPVSYRSSPAVSDLAHFSDTASEKAAHKRRVPGIATPAYQPLQASTSQVDLTATRALFAELKTLENSPSLLASPAFVDKCRSLEIFTEENKKSYLQKSSITNRSPQQQKCLDQLHQKLLSGAKEGLKPRQLDYAADINAAAEGPADQELAEPRATRPSHSYTMSTPREKHFLPHHSASLPYQRPQAVANPTLPIGLSPLSRSSPALQQGSAFPQLGVTPLRPPEQAMASPLFTGSPRLQRKPIHLGQTPPQLSAEPLFQNNPARVSDIVTASLLTDFTKLEREPDSLASRALVLKGFEHHLFNEKSKKFYLGKLPANLFSEPQPLTQPQQEWINDLNKKMLRGLRGRLT